MGYSFFKADDDMFKLKGFDTVFDSTVNNELQDNLVEFFDWALLNKGNYFNVTKGEQATDGSDYSLLSASDNNNFLTGAAWEGFRKNWVWQSGISHSPGPFVNTNDAIPGISGVYVDDTFHASDTVGTYAHKVDYFNGRVVFDTPIPSTSKVQAEYSYKYINVVYAANVPFIRELQHRTLDSAARSKIVLPPEMRVQLPAIAIEVIPRRQMKGYQLGGGQYINQDVLFHCLAEDSYTRNKLVDLVALQNDKSIYLFDSNKISSDNAFPFDVYGFPVSGALRYPEMVQNYYSTQVKFSNASVQDMEVVNSNFSAGIVRCSMEIIDTKV